MLGSYGEGESPPHYLQLAHFRGPRASLQMSYNNQFAYPSRQLCDRRCSRSGRRICEHTLIPSSATDSGDGIRRDLKGEL